MDPAGLLLFRPQFRAAAAGDEIADAVEFAGRPIGVIVSAKDRLGGIGEQAGLVLREIHRDREVIEADAILSPAGILGRASCSSDCSRPQPHREPTSTQMVRLLQLGLMVRETRELAMSAAAVADYRGVMVLAADRARARLDFSPGSAELDRRWATAPAFHGLKRRQSAGKNLRQFRETLSSLALRPFRACSVQTILTISL